MANENGIAVFLSKPRFAILKAAFVFETFWVMETA